MKDKFFGLCHIGQMLSKPSQISHHLIDRKQSLNDFLESQDLPISLAELYQLGAIYLNKERVISDRELKNGDYVRIHPDPKRFDISEIDWNHKLVEDNKDFVIVNKPSGLPTHATLDNLIENTLYQVSRFLGQELLVTSRLDVGTSGLLFFAKTADFQRKFQQWLKEGEMRKFYHARVSCEKFHLTPGRLEHYMLLSKRRPKELSRKSKTASKLCQLDLLQMTPLTDSIYELDIELLTGRTHQIRAQLAFENAPILGDELYGSPLLYDGSPRTKAAKMPKEQFALTCHSLEMPGNRMFSII